MTITAAVAFSGEASALSVASARCLLVETREHVQHATQQDAVAVFLGVWGVDLGNDVDLAQCARSGKLLGTSGRYVPTAPM